MLFCLVRLAELDMGEFGDAGLFLAELCRSHRVLLDVLPHEFCEIEVVELRGCLLWLFL